MTVNPKPTGAETRSARSKVKTLDELAVISARLKTEGKTVALCHGVFDLVHLGHVKHLDAAAAEGDVLIVTVTCDHHVNKGPGRPIFPDHMRAEMLAAMESVDYVAVNYERTAESVLRAIKPDIYVKGSDYENQEEDITGGIALERQMVEEHGGRLVFTHDVTFSSSALINRHLDVYDPPLRDYLDGFRAVNDLGELMALLDAVKGYRVLFVGDTIVDEYHYVEALGKPSKENIIATRSRGQEFFAGGVIAAANHLADFCAEVEIITALGDDANEDLVRKSVKSNINLTLLRREGAPTTKKTRFVDEGYMGKLFEIYDFDDRPLDRALEADVNAAIAKKAPDFDVVIVTDFGHSLISPSTIPVLIDKSRFLAVNAQTNAGNFGFNLITKYPCADYVCIDGNEARLAVADKHSDLGTVVSELLPAKIDCQRMIVTGGYHGCFSFDAANGVHRIPAFTKRVVDTVGAGDAFLAITSPLVAAGGNMEQIGFIGNAVGAMKVGIVGHRAFVEKVALMKFLTTLMK